MPFLLFVAFVVVPLVELALLIQLGSVIGVLPTIAIVVVTALVGTALLRQQGLATIRNAQARAQRGEAPIEELMHGLMIAVGGVMLLTPGLITDAMGLALLLPPVRHFIGRGVWGYLARHGQVHVYSGAAGSTPPPGGPQGGAGSGGPQGRPQPGGRTVIDSDDYEVVEDDGPHDPDPSSPWTNRS